ncbi:MAG: PEP-CTERM sorting domain-containing protein [Isosphaeraceae bacterium]
MRTALTPGHRPESSYPAAIVAIALGLVAIGVRHAEAGGVHILYGPHAPERFAERNVEYYRGLLHFAHNHSREFALDHPFYVKMFNDPVMIDKLLARWEAHQQRFEYWHDCLWKVLDGYRVTHRGNTIGILGHGIPGDRGNPSSGGGSPEKPPAGSNGGQGIQPFSVPEPSGALLLAVGLSFAAIGLRRSRRPSR